jgi:ketosteroid isomerase-like protein
VRSLDVTYADVEVSVLGPEYALVSASFRRQIGMASSTIQQQGGVSWLWRRIDDQWLIAHGHISHPLEPAK